MKERNIILSAITTVMTAIIQLLGFSSCIDAVCEYGTPHADFEVKGKVTNQENEPVPSQIIVSEKSSRHAETVYTDDDGYYHWHASFAQSNEYIVKCVALTPRYEPDSIIIRFKPSGGDGHWYNGKDCQIVDFVLRPEAD